MTRTIKFLTQKELKKLFRVIEREKSHPYWLRNLAIYQTAYLCGLRASEVGLLRRHCFNERVGELFCKRLKGSNSNTIRLDDERTKVLKRYIKDYKITEEDALLFPSRNHNPISRQQLEKMTKAYGQLAKLPPDKQHFHVLKHSIAVHLAESGADVKELQFYLGHKKIENTIIYFQFTTKQQDDFYRKIRHHSQIVT